MELPLNHHHAERPINAPPTAPSLPPGRLGGGSPTTMPPLGPATPCTEAFRKTERRGLCTGAAEPAFMVADRTPTLPRTDAATPEVHRGHDNDPPGLAAERR
ncbi:hypothetical protein GCM10022236_34400 [Microlunatus ginsengisoli]|uniref:Uncharacterized protein n=1 Tax=Microlunatus ginsengisoli TaxID=363863 RepID=A0ABP7ACJ3_9ACTN